MLCYFTLEHGLVSRSERKRHVIVMGDFNDFDGQVLDVSDNIPNSRVLQILSTVREHTYEVRLFDAGVCCRV
jgi:endonuclease/exonuclease/phosphatase family metal-dependent hydrolase